MSMAEQVRVTILLQLPKFVSLYAPRINSGIEWARRSLPSIPIVYVASHHEFYGEHIHDMRQELLVEGRRLGVDVRRN
jgi:hypothetical protein